MARSAGSHRVLELGRNGDLRPLGRAGHRPITRAHRSGGAEGPLTNALARSAEVGRLTGDLPLKRRDGSSFTASYRLHSQFRDETLIGYALLIRDVDASSHLERSLRESEERYRNLVELAPDCIAVLQNNKPVYVNRAGLAAVKPVVLNKCSTKRSTIICTRPT